MKLSEERARRSREKYISINSGGEVRRLAKVVERSNGDLMISLYCGEYNGQTGTDKLKDVHFSVHRSLSMQQRNLVKTTLKSEQSDEIKSYAFTTSIKGREGFWNIATCRFPKLDSPYFNLKASVNNFIIPIEYDETKWLLNLGLAVGDVNAEFDHANKEVFSYSIKTKYFKLAILVALTLGPAIEGGHLLVSSTFDPSKLPNGMSVEHAISRMQGVQWKRCIERFLVSVNVIYLVYINHMRMFLDQCTISERLRLVPIMERATNSFLKSANDRFADSDDVWVKIFWPKIGYASEHYRSISVTDAKTGLILYTKQ